MLISVFFNSSNETPKGASTTGVLGFDDVVGELGFELDVLLLPLPQAVTTVAESNNPKIKLFFILYK